MPRKRSHRDGDTVHGAPAQQKRKLNSPADWKSRLVDATVRSAVEALLKDAEAREKKRAKRAAAKGKMISDLMTSELSVYLVVTLKHPPFKPKLRPYAIALKNSLYREGEDDICFFVKDPEDVVKDYVEENGKDCVTEIMGVQRLRKEFGTHEARRELLNQYDLFLVDNRVSPMMPVLLGNAFATAKKMPLQVDMRKDVVKGIRKAVSSTTLSLRQGTSTTVRVGRIDFDADQVVENLEMAVDGVVRRLPGGWDDIQSLNIKSNKSPSLPIYLTLPTASQPFAKTPEKEEKASGTTSVEPAGDKEASGTTSVEPAGDKEASHAEPVSNEAVPLKEVAEKTKVVREWKSHEKKRKSAEARLSRLGVNANPADKETKKKKSLSSAVALPEGKGGRIKSMEGEGRSDAKDASTNRPPTRKKRKGTESSGNDTESLQKDRTEGVPRKSPRVTRGKRPGSAASTNIAAEPSSKDPPAKKDNVSEGTQTRRSTRKRAATSNTEKEIGDVELTPAAVPKSRSVRKTRSAKK